MRKGYLCHLGLEYWTSTGLYYEKQVEKWVRLDQNGFTELSFVQTALRRLGDFEQWYGGQGGDKSVWSHGIKEPDSSVVGELHELAILSDSVLPVSFIYLCG